MKNAILGATMLAGLALVTGAQAAPTFPHFGADTAPSIVFTFGPNGSVTTTRDTTQGPYDGSDDSYIGVINNSGKTLTSFALSGNSDIFGFDGDGIDTYGAVKSPGNPDTTGYGGPIAYFTVTNAFNGTVNFAGGIADGSYTYFSLEGPPNAINPVVPTPEPATLAVFGMGLFGLAAARRRKA